MRITSIYLAKFKELKHREEHVLLPSNQGKHSRCLQDIAIKTH